MGVKVRVWAFLSMLEVRGGPWVDRGVLPPDICQCQPLIVALLLSLLR